MLLQGSRDFTVRALFNAWTADDHDVPGTQSRLIAPKTVTYDALDAIAIHGAARALARYHQAEAGLTQVVAACQHRQSASGRAPWLIKNTLKFARLNQPLPTRKASAGRLDGRRDRHWNQAESRARPLARRFLMIWRPLAVAMRARKPWVRLRCSLLG